MDVDITRRQAMAAGGAVALGALGLGTYRHIYRSPDVPRPVVPIDRLEMNGWELVDETTDQFEDGTLGPSTLTWQTHTLQFEMTAEREVLGRATVDYGDDRRDVSLGLFERPLSTFTASATSVSPHVFDLPGGQVKRGIRAAAEQEALVQFLNGLEARGFELPEESGNTPEEGNDGVRTEGNEDSDGNGTDPDEELETFETESGYTAKVIEFEVKYPLGEQEFEIADGEQLRIAADTVPVTCRFAVWQPSSYLLSTGGTYPTEDEIRIAAEGEDGREVRVEIEMDRSHDARRDELDEYMRSMRR